MTFPNFLMIIVMVFLVIAVAYLRTPQGKGWLGEFRVKLIIKRTKQGERYVINNLVLLLENGMTCQVDHVLIRSNGIFVIETKNYAGRIYGKEHYQEWTQVLNYGKTKNTLYNPIKQNKTHVYHIANVLSEKLCLTPVVVFVQGNIQYIEATGVYTLYELRELIKSGMPCLTVEQMERAYQELMAANTKQISTSQHVQNIQSMRAGIDNNICPRCGKKLVVRNSKNGPFMGCDGYPNCRFTKRL